MNPEPLRIFQLQIAEDAFKQEGEADPTVQRNNELRKTVYANKTAIQKVSFVYTVSHSIIIS